MTLPETVRRVWPEPAEDVALADLYAMPAGMLRANMVTSLDGAAVFAGRVAPLSNPFDHALLVWLRTLADVVLVGAGTVRAESYGPVRVRPDRQEERLAAGQSPVPPLAVVTASLDLDPAAAFFAEAVARPIVVTCEAAPEARRAALADVADVVTAGVTRVDAALAVAVLRDRGHGRILCEGGPALLAQLSAAGLVDELCLTVSPRLAGPQPGLAATTPLAAPVDLRLHHVVEHDGFLYTRYARPAASP